MKMKNIILKYLYPVLVIVLISNGYSSQVSLSGIVKSSENGNSISNAIISVKNSPIVISSNSIGRFEIKETIPRRAIIKKNNIFGRVQYRARDKMLTWAKNLNIKSISIYSLNGKRLFNFENTNSLTFVKLPNLSSSVLILKVKMERYSICKKMFSYKNLNFTLDDFKRDNLRRHVNDSLTLQISHPDFITYEKKVPINSDYLTVYLSNSPTSDIFSNKKVYTYSVNIDESVYDSLHLTAREEIYRPCTLSFNGKPVGTVGIRFQGSDYHMNMYFDENGNKLTPKVSFKFKFNEYDQLKRFYGLKRLILNAMDTDLTCFRNNLSYSLFNEMGIHSCRTAYARLEINGKYEGLFLVLEPIDGEFLDKRFSGYGDGNLYKEVWPGNTNDTLALVNLKTKEYIGNVGRFIDFSKAMHGMNEDNFITEISKWTDLDNLLKFIAVDRAVIASDGIMTWYVEGKFYGNHNYFWYEENRVGGKFFLLPWDYDCSFYAPDALHDLAGVPRWNEKPTGKTYTIFGDGEVVAPSEDKLIYLLGQTCWDRYVKIAEKFYENQFSKEALLEKIDNITELIEPHLKDDPNLINTEDLTGFETWQQSVEYFKNSIALFRGRYKSLLAGPDTIQIPDPDLTPFNSFTGLWYDRNNNFEFNSNPTSWPYIHSYASESTVCEIDLNTTNPISGNSDMKLSSYFYPTPGEWSEWAAFYFPMKNGSCDFTNTKRILISAKASKSTAIRLTLVSNAYPDPHGVKYGITFNVDTTTEVYKLDPTFFFYPDWDSQADVKEDVLATCTGFEISPEASCLDDGNLIERDTAILFIDDIRFLE